MKKRQPKKGVGSYSMYRKEYARKFLDQYLEDCQDNFENKIKRVKIPTIKGYARYIDVGLSVIDKWRKENVEFDMAIQKLMAIQEDRLINEGLASNYNHVIAKLVLSSNHGFSERSDVTSDGKALPTPIIDVTPKE
jgi:hypothetical protein